MITVPVNDEWVLIGQLYYHDADDRERSRLGPLPHNGRGVMTWWNKEDSTKESWAPPEDEYRCVFDIEYKQWGLYVRADSPTGIEALRRMEAV